VPVVNPVLNSIDGEARSVLPDKMYKEMLGLKNRVPLLDTSGGMTKVPPPAFAHALMAF